MSLVSSLTRSRARLLPTISLLLLATAGSAPAEPGLAPEVCARIDSMAAEVLATTRAPSASIAVVKDGAIVYLKAYGQARLAPPMPASPSMRYAIGSISKQFVAAAITMLVDEGKLTLDDPVSRYFPEVSRANDITVRSLLSHTAGLRDYWPQDYLPASICVPTTTRALMDHWARDPLDFEPGTQYQYSNTGYVIAGAIAEKVSGRPLFDLLRERIFNPLGLTSALDVNEGQLGPEDPTGHMNYGLGPQRPALKEGRGWLFAAGQLAMTAEDLAKWDVSLIEHRLLSSRAWRELTTEVRLENGVGVGYALGLDVELLSARRRISHSGAVSGFTAENRIYPEDRMAVVVLTNHEGNASGELANRITTLLLAAASPGDAEKLDQTRAILLDLQNGRLDRSLFTPNANDYFSSTALADLKASLGPLGAPSQVEFVRQGFRGGFVTRVYRARFVKQTLQIVTRTTPDGRLEQYWIVVE